MDEELVQAREREREKGWSGNGSQVDEAGNKQEVRSIEPSHSQELGGPVLILLADRLRDHRVDPHQVTNHQLLPDAQPAAPSRPGHLPAGPRRHHQLYKLRTGPAVQQAARTFSQQIGKVRCACEARELPDYFFLGVVAEVLEDEAGSDGEGALQGGVGGAGDDEDADGRQGAAGCDCVERVWFRVTRGSPQVLISEQR